MSANRLANGVWLLVLLAGISLPLLLHVLQPAPVRASLSEGRRLAVLPEPSDWLGQLTAMPGRLDAYFADHFGGRGWFQRTHSRLRHALQSPTKSMVVHGRDGWLFFTGDQVLRQVAGELLRTRAVNELSGLLSDMGILLARDQRRLIVAIAPNKHTVYREKLPDWVHPAALTEYDLFLETVGRAGVAAVDLRPVLRAAAQHEQVYHPTDTHWNRLGALIAHNAVMSALSRPEAIVSREMALAGRISWRNGGLARLTGMGGLLDDHDQALAIPDGEDRMRLLDDYVLQAFDAPGYGPGPTVMVIGDSFSRDYWRPYLMHRAARVIWIHHRSCAFDWQQVERYAPDLVIFSMVERGLASCAGNRPRGMPAITGTG